MCAFRYAIGRSTYVVGVVAEQLKDYVRNNNASPSFVTQIITEIDDARRENRMGMDVDKSEWDDCDKALREYMV